MTGLFLNTFECKFKKDYFDLHYLPYNEYESKEAFKNLRVDNADYEFYRFDNVLSNGQTERRIYFWCKSSSSQNILNGKVDRIYISNNPKIISKIIELSIIQHFKNFQKFEIFKKREQHFWNVISPTNLIPEISGLVIRNVFSFNTFFYSHNDELSFNFILSRSLKIDFTIGKNEFEKKQIEYKDLKGYDNVIFANKQSINRFLTATGQQSIYDTKIKILEQNNEEFSKIKQVYDWLNKTKDEIILPDNNKFDDLSMKYLPLEKDKIKADLLEEPTRYYFENRTEKGKFSDVITKLKPYSFKQFENKNGQIVIICPKFNEGILEGFTTSLENCLRNMFHITPKFSNIFLEDTNVKSYEDAIYKEEINTANLVIVILNENHLKITEIKESPYYLCKAKLIGQGIPTQDIQVKHIQKINPFVMNNLALNIYAKIGGTGWTIQNLEKRKEELVVGIGSSINKDGKLVLGIAQIFHSDGRYLVGDCSPLSTFENYASNLEQYLYNSLSKVIDTTINKKVEFRLIFHLFKSASNQYEIKAVENVIKKFQNTNLTFKYAFVHLAYGHNFRLFSNDGNENSPKGTYIELTKHRSLVHFVKESTTPLEIEIDKRSTFEDLRYISTQIYWFSNLSHRTFLPSKKTVTILYPSIMSSLLEKLREIDDWDKIRAEKITDKLWFI